MSLNYQQHMLAVLGVVLHLTSLIGVFINKLLGESKNLKFNFR